MVRPTRHNKVDGCCNSRCNSCIRRKALVILRGLKASTKILRLSFFGFLFLPALFGSKTDDALAAALAQNKAQALTITALTKAVSKGNSDAAVRSADAAQQRDATSATIDVNAAKAEQAVSDAKDTSIRVEAKTDAAVAGVNAAKSSADDAARFGQSNNSMLYVSFIVNLFLFLGVAFQSILKFISDGRTHAWQNAADISAREHTEQLTVLKTQTNGMTERIEKLAVAAGHAQGELDARDAGK